MLQRFGRHHGRAWRKEKAHALEHGLAAWRFAPEEFASNQRTGQSPGRPRYLEIGFGKGEQLLARAKRTPEAFFIGSEVFADGQLALLRGLEAEALSNVRLWPSDVRLLLPRLPSACLTGVWIGYPDPWPKKRHHKRRLLQPEMLQQCARVLCQDGWVELTTDHGGYLAWILGREPLYPDLKLARLVVSIEPSEVPSRYETKARRNGHPAWTVVLKRRSAALAVATDRSWPRGDVA